MKVAHICGVPLAADHPDFGRLPRHPGQWVLDLARAQAVHAGLKPHLIVNVPGSRCDHDSVLEGIPVHYLRCQRRFRAKTFFVYEITRMANLVRRLNPDIVHAHGTEDSYVLAAQKTKLPYVITAQGMFSLINSVVKPRLISRERFIQFIEGYTLRRARHIIAKSEYVSRAIAKAYPRLTIHKVPNTFDPGLQFLQGVKKESCTLLYVGTLDRRKGIHVLREAMSQVVVRFPSVRLWMIGGGRGDSPYIINEEKELRRIMGDRVTFFDILPHSETVQSVALATCLVAPSLEEMFGNQVIEALLAGTHSIVSSDTAMAENIRRFGNGTIFEKGNAGELALAIEKILAKPIFPEAENAREKVFAYMHPARVAKEHRKIYEEILRENSK